MGNEYRNTLKNYTWDTLAVSHTGKPGGWYPPGQQFRATEKNLI